MVEQEMIDVCLSCTRGDCPGNCMKLQLSGQSARGEALLEYRGLKLPLHEWARRFDIDRGTLFHRVRRRGWSMERALTTPVRAKRRHYSMTAGGEPVSMLDLAARCDVSLSTVVYRAKQGWTGDQIVAHYARGDGGQE